MDSLPLGAGVVKFDPSKAGATASLRLCELFFLVKEKRKVYACTSARSVCEVSLQRPACSVIAGL